MPDADQNHHPQPHAGKEPRAMTLTETLIATAGVGLLLVIAALGTSWIRSELKRRQVWELLATLDEALSAYHEAAGQWPVGAMPGDRGPAAGPRTREGPTRQETNDHTDRVIAALSAVPASRAVLERVPEVLRVRPEAGRREPTDESWPAVHDAWGHRLRCLTADSPSEADRQAVAANGGRPIFVSAGPDGQFGTHDPAAAADNVLLLPSPKR